MEVQSLYPENTAFEWFLGLAIKCMLLYGNPENCQRLVSVDSSRLYATGEYVSCVLRIEIPRYCHRTENRNRHPRRYQREHVEYRRLLGYGDTTQFKDQYCKDETPCQSSHVLPKVAHTDTFEADHISTGAKSRRRQREYGSSVLDAVDHTPLFTSYRPSRSSGSSTVDNSRD